MARKIHPVQESSSTFEQSKTSNSKEPISLLHLEEALDFLLKMDSKAQGQSFPEREANNLLEENMNLLDLCQDLTENLSKAKSYADILTSVSRSLDAINRTESLENASLCAKASKAIAVAAKYKISRLSCSCVSVLKSVGNSKSYQADSTTLMKATCRSLMLALEDRKANPLGIRRLFERVLRGGSSYLRELESAQMMIQVLHVKTKDSKRDSLLLGSSQEFVGQLEKSTAELEEGICRIEKKLQKFYQSLIKRQVTLLDCLSFSQQQ